MTYWDKPYHHSLKENPHSLMIRFVASKGHSIDSVFSDLDKWGYSVDFFSKYSHMASVSF